MNRFILITVLLLAGTAGVAVAQDAPPAPAPAPVSLETMLTKKNIFDPTRTGGIRPVEKPRPKIIRIFTFHGTMDDVALFTGEGVVKGYVRRGDTLNGFKVMKIPVSYSDPTVILTDPTGAIVMLNEGESMRREEDGPWEKSTEAAPATVATTDVKSDAPSPPSSGPAGESDILKRLRLKRQQEDK